MSIHKRYQARTGLKALPLALKILEALGSPRAQLLHAALRSEDHRAVVALSDIDPSKYLDPYSFFLDYQSAKLLSKYAHLNVPASERELVAKKKFIECEARCRETNNRIRARDSWLKPREERILSNASRKISQVLGPVPALSALDFRFGPGASYGVRRDTSAYKKLQSFECTFAFAGIAPLFLEEFPGWFDHETNYVDLTVVPGSQLTFVPKNAKTDRPICIEPNLNGLYQKGFGNYIRGRLKRFGIDLKDQSVNQRLAQKAYVSGLSTIDFSSASDLISYNLVLDLLPIDWFEALDVARCPRYEADGSWYNFHKFTSMGNAYTFELESLIFFALACACCEELGINYTIGESLSVYGDDVIIPRDAFDLFTEVSEVCGFLVNRGKSYRDGSFFESCGKDYFMGVPVRPIFLKEDSYGKFQLAYFAINSIWRIAQRLHDVDAVRSVHVRGHLGRVHSWAVDCLPPELRFLGPVGESDNWISAPWDQAATSGPTRLSTCPHGYDQWRFRCVRDRSVRVSISDCHSAWALYCAQDCSGSWLFGKEPGEPLDSGSSYGIRGRSFEIDSWATVPLGMDWSDDNCTGTPFTR